MKKRKRHVRIHKAAKKHHKKRKYSSEEKLKMFAVFALIVAAAAFFTYDKSGVVEDIRPFENPYYPFPAGRPDIREIYHTHADFLVVVNGKNISFNRPEFDYVNPVIHLHMQNFMGDKVMHVESASANMGDFFSSLDMGFNSTCFFVDETDYCTNNTHVLKLYVNGFENSEFDFYHPEDLDRILVTFGNQTEGELQSQINSVTELACIFSEKCAAPPEAENKIFYN